MTAIIVSIKEKLIDWNIGLWVATSGIVGAIIGAKISVKMNVELLRKLFGIFLATIAIYEIYSLIKQYRFNKKTNNK
ncbi:MAG: TSUP family transporter [Clostridia bacterium]